MPHPNALEAGLKTPSWGFYGPILAALVARNGRERLRYLYAPVRLEMTGVLNDHDLEELDNSTPEPRWMNTMRVARDELVKRGFIQPTSVSGHGVWEIQTRAAENSYDCKNSEPGIVRGGTASISDWTAS